ncbi:hypothetical protein F4818DRAFT_456953 [Hypoxylon cercidicola]|nr:hypothetical protein F4818DRAFT_456953 [Hypoxylon cercidicola]
MLRDHEVRDSFFDGRMQRLLVLSAKPRRIDVKATMIKCADSITAYIERFANETETSAALSHLEGVHFPYNLLPDWISRLGSLTSLRIRDGSVLGVEAASAISACCPNFVDLTCYYCMCEYLLFQVAILLPSSMNQSSSADEDLAAFFQTLRPNSLQSFEVISQNGIGEQALTALTTHATSLRSLILGSLPPAGMTALNSLASCTSLEKLSIENDPHNLRIMTGMDGLLNEISAWISSCKSLRDLSFNHFFNVLPVVKDVLAAPDIHLQSLSIEDFSCYLSADGTSIGEATWVALGTQDRLESLTLGLQNGSIDHFLIRQGSSLANSIMSLQNLVSLNLMQVHVELPVIRLLPAALPSLAEFSFSGDNVDDSILDPLSTLSHLKLLSINAPSSFTYFGLLEFIRKLATPKREGMRIDILYQHGHLSFGTEEIATLGDVMRVELKGRIDITYTSYPDELHEEDFSEYSD